MTPPNLKKVTLHDSGFSPPSALALVLEEGFDSESFKSQSERISPSQAGATQRQKAILHSRQNLYVGLVVFSTFKDG